MQQPHYYNSDLWIARDCLAALMWWRWNAVYVWWWHASSTRSSVLLMDCLTAALSVIQPRISDKSLINHYFFHIDVVELETRNLVPLCPYSFSDGWWHDSPHCLLCWDRVIVTVCPLIKSPVDEEWRRAFVYMKRTIWFDSGQLSISSSLVFLLLLALLNTKHQEMYKKLNWYNVVGFVVGVYLDK